MWFRAILILLVIAGIGYSVLWYIHADNTRNNLIKTIEAMNVEKGPAEWKYGEITLGGYPFSFEMRMSNPVIRLREGALMNMFGLPAANTQPSSDITEEIAIPGGALILTGDYLNRRFGFAIEGDTTGTSRLGDKTLNWQASWDGKSHCDLTLNKDADLSVFSMLEESMFKHLSSLKNFTDIFQRIECRASDVVVTDKDSGETLATVPEEYILFDGDFRSKESFNMKMELLLGDIEISKRYQDWVMSKYAQYLPQEMTGIYLSYPEMGKQTIDIAMAVQGDGNIGRNGMFKLDMPRFTIKNAMQHITLPAGVDLTYRDGQLTGSLDIDGRMSMTELYDDYMKGYMHSTIDMLYQEMEARSGSPEIPKKQAYDIAERVMPDWSEIGEIRLRTDADIKGSQRKDIVTPLNTDVSIHAFDFLAGEKGLSISGNWMANNTGDLALTCHHCETTLTSLLHYAADIQQVITLFDPKAGQIPINDNMVKEVLNFVRSLSREEGDNWNIAIHSEGMDNITISGKTMQEVMMLAMPLMAQFAPPPPAQ